MNGPSRFDALFESIDTKRTQDFLGFLTEDAVFRYGSHPEAAGRTTIGAAVDQFFASIESSRHELRLLWERPDAVVCQGDVHYVRRDGRKLTLPFCNVFRMRGDKIARYEIYIDPAPLFAA
jgi:ketosteroid isomerase-like protein